MSTLSSLLPLLLLLLFLAAFAYLAYQISLWSSEMSSRGKAHMEKKNMTFTKDGGLKVGVREVGQEKELDRTQNVLVNVWNSASPGPGGAGGKKDR